MGGLRSQATLGSNYLAAGLRLLLTFAAPLALAFRSAAAEPSDQPYTSQDTASQVKSAEAWLETGNGFYQSGDYKEAEAAWSKVRTCPETVSAWPKAVFNLGILEMNQAHYSTAIEYFHGMLRSHPNDKEPGGNIMEAYRNYSHRSVLGISQCYEKMGNYRQALRYARLAKTQYPYLSWCGTCLRSADFAQKKRIAYLAARLYGPPSLGFMALAGGFLFWRRAKAA